MTVQGHHPFPDQKSYRSFDNDIQTMAGYGAQYVVADARNTDSPDTMRYGCRNDFSAVRREVP